MNYEQEEVKAPSFWQREKILIKGLFTGILTLVMLIPQSMINGLVWERSNRQKQVVEEVSSKWAKPQTVTGPILCIPYAKKLKADGSKNDSAKSMLYILPEQLNVAGEVFPKVKHRSLYNVSLYTTVLNISGNFSPIPFESLKLNPDQIYWEDVILSMMLSDNRGIYDDVSANWNGTKNSFQPGYALNRSALNTSVKLDPKGINSFKIPLKLKGTEKLYFTPVGKTTEVDLKSTWSNPVFDGEYLPDNTEANNDKGFVAHWKVVELGREYPQIWQDETYELSTSNFGVALQETTNSYVKTDRAIKYALLFIALSFATFFFLELILKKKMHPLQYLLVGFALLIFYTLLLSISEYTGFNIAYCIASVATIALIVTYIANIFKKRQTVILFSIALSGLYGYIFVIIQLQDFALLFGSVGLFFILAIFMYASKKIDWFDTNTNNPVPAA